MNETGRRGRKNLPSLRNAQPCRMVFSHKKITFPCAIVDFTGVMKINVYTTHDKLSAMTEATSE
ncbi:imidazolonepropionase, partial [Escherichia coli]|nr:imidazolonepropionase [Escherichia coli]